MADIKPVADMNIHERLYEIGKMVEVLKKNATGHNYSYTDESSILAGIAAGTDKYRVKLELSMVPGTFHADHIQPASGRPVYLAQCEMEYTWVNIDRPEDRLVIRWPVSGSQAEPSQALGSGLTYSNRYFLLKFFQVATVRDDPDFWMQAKQETAAAADAGTVQPMIGEIDRVIHDCMDSMEREQQTKFKKELTAVVKATVRDRNGKPSANYLTISAPDVAQKVLSDVTELVRKYKEEGTANNAE